MIRQLDDRTLVSGQIAPEEVAGLAEQGVTVLVNNRPDGEESDQPLARDLEEAAAAAGIAYHYIPITRGIGPADIDAMEQAMNQAGGGKVLAFCRSGTRSALTCGLVHRQQGSSAQEVSDRLTQAGFDPGPITHLL